MPSPRNSLLVLLLGLLAGAGCAPVQTRRWTEHDEPPPSSRRLVRLHPIVAGAEFRATEHRIEFEVEGIYDVEGVRRAVVYEAFRDHDPWVEVGEMSLGLLLAPSMIVFLPIQALVIVPLQAYDQGSTSVVEYLRFIPEKALDPTENDLFVADERIVEVSRRDEPYHVSRSEPLSPDEAARLELRVGRVEMLTDQGERTDLTDREIVLDGWDLILPEPRAGIVSYEVDLYLQGESHSLHVEVE